MIEQHRDSDSPLLLRLFEPDDRHAGMSDGPKLSARITLTEFFSRWYLPVVLRGEHEAPAGTVELYRTALQYWSQITDDPPLSLVDEYTVSRFQSGLREATFRRSPIGPDYPLARATQAKHLARVKAVLCRCGPTIDAKRPGKGLIDLAPYVHVPQVDCEPKDPFRLRQVRLIMAACGQMTAPAIPGIEPPAWWRAAVCLLFYTGLRWGTIFARQLSWDKVEQRDDGHWLILRSADVSKTGKRQKIALHVDALRAIEAIRTSRSAVIPWPHSESHFRDLHAQLQLAAGIKPVEAVCQACFLRAQPGQPWERPRGCWRCRECGDEHMLPPQAWRRTHSVQMAEGGLHDAMEVARRALNHSDVRTTAGSYVSIEAKVIRRLPSILPAEADESRQLRLF